MKKVIMIAGGGFGQTTLSAVELAKKGIDMEIISPEEATERGLTITSQINEPMPLRLYDERIYCDTPPPTRAERRKKARSKNKK